MWLSVKEAQQSRPRSKDLTAVLFLDKQMSKMHNVGPCEIFRCLLATKEQNKQMKKKRFRIIFQTPVSSSVDSRKKVFTNIGRHDQQNWTESSEKQT